jgi:hypothetical protein
MVMRPTGADALDRAEREYKRKRLLLERASRNTRDKLAADQARLKREMYARKASSS